MITMRPAAERGVSDLGWLDSKHTFSFAEYFDRQHMGFGPLRVINDDRVAPGGGFGTHGHNDMEIVSYVLEGSLKHEDSMGTGSVIKPGEVQRMSAGTGVMHSEMNGSDTEQVHFLQIWILPEENGINPGYEQKYFPADERQGKWRLVGSCDGAEGSVTIRQDVKLYATLLNHGESLEYSIEQGRKGWLHVCSGTLRVNDIDAGEGDGFAIDGPETITLLGKAETEVLLFDMTP